MNSIPVHSSGDNKDFFEIVKLKERNSYDSTKAHKHSYFEIFLFNKGGGTHEIDFNIHPVLSQSVHFVFPNQVHKVTRELDTFGFVILISKEFMDRIDYKLYLDLFSVYYLDPIVKLNTERFNKISLLLDNLTDEFTNDELNSKSVIKNYLSILFNFFLREKENKTSSDSYKSDEFTLFINFLILIENHYETHNPVQFYSSKLQTTERHLNLLCKKFKSKTASVLIKERMILEIKKMLVNSSFSIKEIVYSLKFNDPANFNKFFKSVIGVSPSQFREEFGK